MSFLNEIKAGIESKSPLKNNQCFNNCIWALEHNLIDIDEWFYTEGVLETDYQWIYHAWLTNRDGEIWDLTTDTEGIYHPRYLFDSHQVYDLMEKFEELPLTHHIYVKSLNKDVVIHDGYEFEGFDYSKWPEQYQGPLAFLTRSA